MKQRRAILLIVITFIPMFALSQEKSKLPTRDEVLKAVETFATSPLSTESAVAVATIVTFADESEDVTVVISTSLLPWVAKEKPPKIIRTLLAAYVAGNVKSQLERKINSNDSYAGVQQLLTTYAQLKKSDKTLDIPEIQKLVELDSKKELKKYIEDKLQEDNKKTTE